MDEYIKRKAVIDLITRRYENPEICTQEINSIPAADVAPVVHGHKVDDGGFYARCSQCDGVLPLCANYCPNCGAKMDGGADNG